eukprot:GHVQ01004729.1.p1 GENE.GHVQ01004729.1~~GHVQ01004729.1.p1  ORF type:complete len:351 (+),score=99.15 GHVQ01004729.1:160-1212(+)
MDDEAAAAALAEQIEQLEADALREKHWSLLGEVHGEKRPKNSLLEIHVDVPKKSCGKDASEIIKEHNLGDGEEDDETRGEVGAVEALDFSTKIEDMIKQRIMDLAFDDVVRQTDIAPANAEASNKDLEKEVLDFEKSRVGLGEVYARQFEKQFLGSKSVEEDERDKKVTKTKEEVLQLFSKLMYKLDSLSNRRFTPRPPSVTDSGGAAVGVSAITVEDTIPVVMSHAQRQAPEEVCDASTSKKPDEMSQEERRALRAANKQRRKKKLEGKVMSGEWTVHQLKDRQQQLADKNLNSKVERDNVKETGLGVKQKRQNDDVSKRRRLGLTELLVAAGQADTEKAKVKKQRREQ